MKNWFQVERDTVPNTLHLSLSLSLSLALPPRCVPLSEALPEGRLTCSLALDAPEIIEKWYTSLDQKPNPP